MEKETRDERMTSFETKMAVAKAFLYKCGTTLEELEERIAKESIDYTGTLEGNYSLLLRILRGRDDISTEYYQHGEDGYNDHERFRYEFSLYFYRDMPSGYYVRETSDGTYYLVDENEQYLQEIDIDDLKSTLIDDLLERNAGRFNEEFEEFLQELYTWIMEED
jgi:hypothetical protein